MDGRFTQENGNLYFSIDKNNDEKFNLYRLESETGDVKQLTDINYLSDYSFNSDETKIAYSDRTGNEGARYLIHVLDLQTSEDRVIAS